MSSTPIFVATPSITPIAFTNADSANTKKTAVTAGSNGSKIVGITVTSTETANARLAQIWLTRSATSYLLATVNIPINSGFDGTAAVVNLMNPSLWPGLPVDNDGQPYFFAKNGDTIQVSLTTQVASGKEVDITANSGDF